MNAVLAIIAGSGRAIGVIYREGVEIIFFSLILLILLKSFDDGLVQPLLHRPPGVGYAHPSKPCRWRGIVCLCLASKKPSEREFFVPAGTDLGVKLLIPLETSI